MSKNVSKDILNKVKQKTGKNISENQIKKLASNVKPSTMQSESQLRELIKQVSNMAKIPVSEATINDIIKTVKSSGGMSNMESVMKMLMKK
ncbi:stage VI sporulation protein F [Paenibacillus guangzhouensis]|uniref:stage VI sporulation protein F n=1 Tax=Paenibacillus guangzhouensis TaxID=1473112 RepID=UPI001266A664|nr:stage VI sporulation protein F [Paenibacillus guangzhouensis]